MLKAYFDDSGTHAGADVCVLAGYFGSEKEWYRFETRWNEILRRNRIGEFHAKTFWARDPNGNRVGEYKDWSEDHAETFISELLGVITASRIFPIGSAVLMRDWAALSLEERRYLTGGQYRIGKFTTSGAPNKPYFLPFLFAIQKTCQYCKHGLKVHFAFDRNDPYCGYAFDYYKDLGQLRLSCSSQLGSIFFPTSVEAPPLQAADLLAYHTYQYGKLRWTKERHVDLPPIVLLLLKRIRSRRNDFKLYDKYSLDIVLKRFRSSFQVPDP